MTPPAALHRALDIDVSPATLAHVAAAFMPLLAASTQETTPGHPRDTSIPVIRAELNAITAEMRELRADAAIATRMPATGKWRKEITADRAALTRRAEYLRLMLDTALAPAPVSAGGRS